MSNFRIYAVDNCENSEAGADENYQNSEERESTPRGSINAASNLPSSEIDWSESVAVSLNAAIRDENLTNGVHEVQVEEEENNAVNGWDAGHGNDDDAQDDFVEMDIEAAAESDSESSSFSDTCLPEREQGLVNGTSNNLLPANGVMAANESSIEPSAGEDSACVSCICADVAGPSNHTCPMHQVQLQPETENFDPAVDEGVGLPEREGDDSFRPLAYCVPDCEACTTNQQQQPQVGDVEPEVHDHEGIVVEEYAGTICLRCACKFCADKNESIWLTTNPSCHRCGYQTRKPKNYRRFTSATARYGLGDAYGFDRQPRPPFINVAGPNGVKLSRETYLSKEKSDLIQMQSNSALLTHVFGNEYHTFILKNSCPTFEYKLWSFEEAESWQISQLGPSACGATAVANVLKALDHDVSIEEIVNVVKTKIRAGSRATLAEYLLSRSVAGTTHSDLIDAVQKLTSGTICGRFFYMYPRRRVYLMAWLLYWMKMGCIPLLCMNLQRGVPNTHLVPDAWHHQMAFGGGARGVHVTNPIFTIQECELAEYLCSDSILLVRAEDVRTHYENGSDLSPIIFNDDLRWYEMNVVGEIIKIIRQPPDYEIARGEFLTHLAIPAIYKSGVTLFARKDSEVWKAIENAPEIAIDD